MSHTQNQEVAQTLSSLTHTHHATAATVRHTSRDLPARPECGDRAGETAPSQAPLSYQSAIDRPTVTGPLLTASWGEAKDHYV